MSAQRSPALACEASGACLLVEENNAVGNYNVTAHKFDVEQVLVPLVLR